MKNSLKYFIVLAVTAIITFVVLILLNKNRETETITDQG